MCIYRKWNSVANNKLVSLGHLHRNNKNVVDSPYTICRYLELFRTPNNMLHWIANTFTRSKKKIIKKEKQFDILNKKLMGFYGFRGFISHSLTRIPQFFTMQLPIWHDKKTKLLGQWTSPYCSSWKKWDKCSRKIWDFFSWVPNFRKQLEEYYFIFDYSYPSFVFELQ